jgi:hypothetical protein
LAIARHASPSAKGALKLRYAAFLAVGVKLAASMQRALHTKIGTPTEYQRTEIHPNGFVFANIVATQAVRVCFAGSATPLITTMPTVRLWKCVAVRIVIAVASFEVLRHTSPVIIGKRAHKAVTAIRRAQAIHAKPKIFID